MYHLLKKISHTSQPGYIFICNKSESWPTISDKNYGKKCYLDNFVFLSLSLSEQCWGIMSKTCVKQCYQFTTLYKGRGRILNTLFKIPIIFCQWLSEIYQNKKKTEVWCMLLQITQICFYESHYVTLHSDISIIKEDDAKITQKLPQYSFWAIIIWLLSEKCYLKHTMTYAAVWLSFYVFIFAILTYLTTVNQCLTIFFVQKLCAIGKIFIRWSEKKHQIIEKVDMSKMPPVNPLF